MSKVMKFTNLGESGLRVSRVCVGCMSYGSPDSSAWMIPEEEALPILGYCYKKNFNFYDTANVYSNGVSEEILGKAIKKYNWRRENVVIATKVYGVVGRGENAMNMNDDVREQSGYVNQFGLSRKHIFELHRPVSNPPMGPKNLGRPVGAFSDTTRGEGLKEGIWGRPWTESDKKTNDKIEEIAKARGATMAVVATAWSLSKPFIHSPIVGLSSEKRVDEAIEAMNFELTKDEIKSINDIYETHAIMGHE